MKTEKYYIDKIAKSEVVVQKHKANLDKFRNPPPLKAPKGKTKIISFRVSVDRADELKAECTKLLNKLI